MTLTQHLNAIRCIDNQIIRVLTFDHLTGTTKTRVWVPSGPGWFRVLAFSSIRTRIQDFDVIAIIDIVVCFIYTARFSFAVFARSSV